MKTFCELGRKLSEAAEYARNLPLDYSCKITIREYGILVEVDIIIYGMTLSAREGVTWRVIHEKASLSDIIDNLCDQLSALKEVAKWNNMPLSKRNEIT